MQPELNSHKNLKIRGFSVEKLLGKGAFATVYLCRKHLAWRRYAAKVVECNDNKKLKWETENEIEVLRELNRHRHIVRLHGVLRDAEQIVMILEHVPAAGFLEGILNWPRFDENSVIEVMKQLLSALGYCHSKRIIHRDVCPDNIMFSDVPTLRKPNTIPSLKLIDFNLGRNIPEHSNFLQADPLGNPSYMAPECLTDNPIVTFATDVWSAGIIMFTLLCGYPPFWNDNYNHLLDNIKEANYVLPPHLWNHVSQDVQDIVKSILCSDFNSRLSVNELLEERWFQKATLGEENWENEWLGHTRLTAFLQNLNKQKKSMSHRKYNLSYKEREAFIPDVNMITFSEANNQYEDVNNNYNVGENNNIAHW